MQVNILSPQTVSDDSKDQVSGHEGTLILKMHMKNARKIVLKNEHGKRDTSKLIILLYMLYDFKYV